MSNAPAAAPSGHKRPVQTGVQTGVQSGVQTGVQTGGVPAAQQVAKPNQGAAPPSAPQSGGPGMLAELKVSGHVMTLEAGLYCVVHKPASAVAAASGLPAIRISLPPHATGVNERVSVSAFRADGWLATSGDAALVRVTGGPGQILVTIYQPMGGSERHAPNIQVMRLLESGAAATPRTAGAPATAAPAEAAPGAVAPVQRRAAPAAAVAAAAPAAAAAAAAAAAPAAVMEMVAHIQERGDVGAMFGDWLGERGSKRWIEGFGLSPTQDILPHDIEYQGVLGQGWLSPWVEGGQFCGSRGMALPLLGLRVRLRGEALERFDVVYAASFIDGSQVGPVMNGEACEADSLAAMEAFQITLRRRDELASGDAGAGAAAARRTRRPTAPTPEEPARPRTPPARRR